jgi:hypothetical protein
MKIYVGDTGTQFFYAFLGKDGAYNLTGASIETHFIRQSDQKHKVGTGEALVNQPESQGLAVYSVGETDVDEEGTWMFYPIVTVGGKPQHFIPQFIEIERLEPVEVLP